MVNNPLIRPYFLGGLALGGWGPLDSRYINRAATSTLVRHHWMKTIALIHLLRCVLLFYAATDLQSSTIPTKPKKTKNPCYFFTLSFASNAPKTQKKNKKQPQSFQLHPGHSAHLENHLKQQFCHFPLTCDQASQQPGSPKLSVNGQAPNELV